MQQVQIVVREDDGVSVEDGLRLHVPLIHNEDSATVVAFSEGTLLRIAKDPAYADGPWRITRIQAGLAVYERHAAVQLTTGWDHSDRVRLTGGDDQLRWVVIGEQEYSADNAPDTAEAAPTSDAGAEA